jgi:hypothetical protein
MPAVQTLSPGLTSTSLSEGSRSARMHPLPRTSPCEAKVALAANRTTSMAHHEAATEIIAQGDAALIDAEAVRNRSRLFIRLELELPRIAKDRCATMQCARGASGHMK